MKVTVVLRMTGEFLLGFATIEDNLCCGGGYDFSDSEVDSTTVPNHSGRCEDSAASC